MADSLLEAALFLVNIFFDCVLFVFILRLLFQLVRADFYNPLSQIIDKITRPVVRPMQRIFPTIKRFDLAVVVIIIAAEMLKLSIIIGIRDHLVAKPLGLFVWSIGDILNQCLNVLFYATLLQIILSWIQPHTFNPFVEVLYRLSSPLLKPAQRVIPPIGGIDLSPIPVLIGLELIQILVSHPVILYGRYLTLA